jgi:hypothetical protein
MTAHLQLNILLLLLLLFVGQYIDYTKMRSVSNKNRFKSKTWREYSAFVKRLASVKVSLRQLWR